MPWKVWAAAPLARPPESLWRERGGADGAAEGRAALSPHLQRGLSSSLPPQQLLVTLGHKPPGVPGGRPRRERHRQRELKPQRRTGEAETSWLWGQNWARRFLPPLRKSHHSSPRPRKPAGTGLPENEPGQRLWPGSRWGKCWSGLARDPPGPKRHQTTTSSGLRQTCPRAHGPRAAAAPRALARPRGFGRDRSPASLTGAAGLPRPFPPAARH